jgi:ribosomal protein S9
VFSTKLQKFCKQAIRIGICKTLLHFSAALKEALNNLEMRVHAGLQQRTNRKKLNAIKKVGENSNTYNFSYVFSPYPREK